MDLVLELKNNASKLLLAIMESRTSDPENVAEKIIFTMNPKQLVINIVNRLSVQNAIRITPIPFGLTF
jgi:hypothetical protein